MDSEAVLQTVERNSRSIVANMLSCEIPVRVFELQSHNYVHFRFKTLAIYCPLSSLQWVRLRINWSSASLALTLNNPRYTIKLSQKSKSAEWHLKNFIRLRHLTVHDLGKSMWYCQILTKLTKILQNF